MYQKLVSHNDDIGRLVEKGFAVGFDSNYLIVRDIPYLDSDRKPHIGAIVTKMVAVDKERVQQDDHQIFFAGGVPHGLDGRPIPNLAGGPCGLALGDGAKDVVVERSFSNKPKVAQKFVDFFEKIESYVTIISGPATELHGISPYTHRMVDEVASDSVFKIRDTLTSRAEITDLSAKFKDDAIAIIGLGGTGAYVLDFLVKTPVREIRAFDLDVFHVHTAFRSPGRLQEDELGQPKTKVYDGRYDNFRTGLSSYPKFVDASCGDDFEGVTFAFVCVDKGSSRAGIFDLLLARGIPFIDVGMGLKRKKDQLTGMARATYYSKEDGEKVRAKSLAELTDRPDNMYRTNIQIGELNALNAALAVIRFKQLRGFYLEEPPYYHLLFGVSDLKIAGSSDVNED
jgi:hypothetical protein